MEQLIRDEMRITTFNWPLTSSRELVVWTLSKRNFTAIKAASPKSLVSVVA